MSASRLRVGVDDTSSLLTVPRMEELHAPESQNGTSTESVMDYVPNSILVTGGAGFIGSCATIELCRTYPNCKVIVYDRLGAS